MLQDIEDHRTYISKPFISTLTPQIRAGFLRKVYSLLSLQTLFTFSACLLVLLNANVSYFMLSSTAITIYQVSIIVSLTSLLVLYYCALHKYPLNVLLFSLFTCAITFQLGFVTALCKARDESVILLMSLGTTVTIFCSLTSYVIISKRDFEFLNTFLIVCMVTLIVFSIVLMLIPIQMSITGIVSGGLGTVTFSGYILYDTSQLFHRLGPDDYIEAVIHLYLDIINLFLCILNMMQSISQD